MLQIFHLSSVEVEKMGPPTPPATAQQLAMTTVDAAERPLANDCDMFACRTKLAPVSSYHIFLPDGDNIFGENMEVLQG